MREDFTEKTKRVIQERAGNRCSNLDCRVLTSGPNAHPEKSTKIGVAAHITAASPGGPRYDSSQTPDQRMSADNGIWLCQRCAHFIDADYLNYSVQLLNQWKVRAEKDADDETKGRPKVFHDATPIESEPSEGWECPFCGTVVELGRFVCLGCDAEVVPGLTAVERKSNFQMGVMLGAIFSFVIFVLSPKWLNSTFDWRIESFWGIGIYALIIGVLISVFSGVALIHFLEQDRHRQSPRFFRPSVR